jgi:hypothetical protein
MIVYYCLHCTHEVGATAAWGFLTGGRRPVADSQEEVRALASAGWICTYAGHGGTRRRKEMTLVSKKSQGKKWSTEVDQILIF